MYKKPDDELFEKFIIRFYFKLEVFSSLLIIMLLLTVYLFHFITQTGSGQTTSFWTSVNIPVSGLRW